MNRRDLFLRLRAVVARRRVDRELDDELAFHLERETQKHVAAGLSPADARARALARFGSVPLAADQCRDARGIGLLDDLARDIAYALRTFRRAPLAAVTIVATVALGLGLVTAVFAIYDVLLLRADAVQNPGQLFAVAIGARPAPDNPSTVVFTREDYAALRRETRVFTDVVAVADYAGPFAGHLTRSARVSGNFFQMLGVHAALGRSLLPEDDEDGAGRRVIVLSHRGWRKLFQSDPAIVGRRVAIDGVSYEIVGVTPEGFRGLGITPPDFWAPLSLDARVDGNAAGRADQLRVEVIGRLQADVSREAATSALTTWALARNEFNGGPDRQTRAWLTPRQGTLSADDLSNQLAFAPLFFSFGLILLIGCANVANLLLARGVARQREIGVRLSLGASRRRIVRQLLTESLLLALAAAAGALVVSRLFLQIALAAALRTIPPEFVDFVSALNVAAPAADWRMQTFVVAGAVISTAFFGLAPALQTTRLDVVRTMRGDVTRDANPRGARQALIAVQVGASALLLICAAIFLRGAISASTQAPGIRTGDTLRVSIEAERERAHILQALTTDPSVAVVSASSRPAHAVIETSSQTRMPVDRLGVSSEYFGVLGLDLVSGRGFTAAERTEDAGVAVVSQSVARELWPAGNGVGQMLRVETLSPAGEHSVASVRTLTVVGIVREAGRASSMAFRGVYVPTTVETPVTWLFVRVRGNLDQARLHLMGRLTGLDPAFGVITLGNGMQAVLLRIAFGLAIVLAGLALALTVSGLFSVLSYVVEQQAKDIGVRIALGAAPLTVVRMVLSQSLRPVAVGFAAGAGLAIAVAIGLRATPAAAEIAGVIDVADPVAYAASALVTVVACLIAISVPTVRAATIDPIVTLRRD